MQGGGYNSSEANEYGEDGWIATEDGEGEYPIQCVMFTVGNLGYFCNIKALSFIAAIARLGKELDQFEDERGGLLIEDENGNNTLQYLAMMSHYSNEEEHHRRIDIACLSQFIQLRQMDLLVKDDIPEYNLFCLVCSGECHFSENRFRFLVEWDPKSLVSSPLHTSSCCIFIYSSISNCI